MNVPLESMLSPDGVYACDWSQTFGVWRAFYTGEDGRQSGLGNNCDGATPREAIEKAYPLALANILLRSDK